MWPMFSLLLLLPKSPCYGGPTLCSLQTFVADLIKATVARIPRSCGSAGLCATGSGSCTDRPTDPCREQPLTVHKGLKNILSERGLWPAAGMNVPAARKLLALQPDFKAQKGWLVASAWWKWVSTSSSFPSTTASSTSSRMYPNPTHPNPPTHSSRVPCYPWCQKIRARFRKNWTARHSHIHPGSEGGRCGPPECALRQRRPRP